MLCYLIIYILIIKINYLTYELKFKKKPLYEPFGER